MEKNDIKAAAERYRQEMMDMYGRKQAYTAADIRQGMEEAETPSDKTNETKDGKDKDGEESTAEGLVSDEEDIEKRFPPPVIPDFIKAVPPPKPPEDAFGYLKVSVRTGGGGIPIGGNPVMISRSTENGEDLVRMLMTDQSGDTETVKLSTYKNPDGVKPDDYKAATEYNISVGSEGYFTEESRGVSIFDGVTSVQTFNLIPEPFDYTTDDTVIFDNPEPEVTA